MPAQIARFHVAALLEHLMWMGYVCGLACGQRAAVRMKLLCSDNKSLFDSFIRFITVEESDYRLQLCLGNILSHITNNLA